MISQQFIIISLFQTPCIKYLIFGFYLRLYQQQLEITMDNYSYLKPPSKVTKSTFLNNVPTETGEKYSFKGDNSNFTNEEAQSVERLKQYIKRKNLDRQIGDELLLRYCYLTKMSIIESVEKFKFYEQWWKMEPISKQKQRGILHSGVFYTYGRDLQYSPNIYFHPDRIDLKDFAIIDYLVSLRTLLTPIQQHMLYPGKIEKWNLIVDLRAFNQNKFKSNYSVFLNNLNKVINSYPLRLKRLFLILPGGYDGLWSKVVSSSKSFNLTYQVINEINLQSYCIKIQNLCDFQKYIGSEEREKQYGGALDDLIEYWPISSTNRLLELNSRFIEGTQESEQYNSVENNVEFFGIKQEKATLCNLKEFCCIQ